MEITPNSIAILWPTFALVLLIFVVWATMGFQRMAHVRDHPPTRSDIADRAGWEAYFRPVERPAANLANLFEMPVLFLVLVPLLIVMRQASHAQILLAWIFVALRAAHSLVHVRRGSVRVRFYLYVASCVILSAMWIGFAVDVVAMAQAVRATL
ncbi:MAPEG family protein [Sphingomonas nostoxanthinifaciens]|uniref:MAPEG family protein n=1 Tax=Sphingomonas nostoxanthinifaciens TaxID=2872652 RepID=UPI001CC1C806|nr:MAPEG family protein [Sphingomonas nostoxanthinifaciens]UAK24514.1 MAPEG family protein [Sphingomonas nostoxanthinifaciens]